MNSSVIADLERIAGPDLYRRNAFRLTGLPTDATRRTVRQRQQQVVQALKVGATVDLGHTLSVGHDDVSSAFDRLLEDPGRRLVDELFWLWDTPDATCGCRRGLHEDHDEVVRAHAAALDMETSSDGASDGDLDELEQYWVTAADGWARLLRRVAFWDHVRHRIDALDDRRLDESAIEVLRDAMPGALVKPMIMLAAAAENGDRGWLAEQARRWTVDPRLVDEQLESVAELSYDIAETATKAVLTENDEDPAEAATMMYERVLPALDQLAELVPADRHRRTASAYDAAALALNNCAARLINAKGTASATRARNWLHKARELATDPGTTERIKSNAAALRQLINDVAEVKRQVEQLVATGRTEVARRMLQQLRYRVGDGAESVDIARMLADLGGVRRSSAGAQPFRQRRHVPVRQPARGGVLAMLGQTAIAVVSTVVSFAVLVGIILFFAYVVFDADDDSLPAPGVPTLEATW